jgi:hypothetical protein
MGLKISTKIDVKIVYKLGSDKLKYYANGSI